MPAKGSKKGKSTKNSRRPRKEAPAQKRSYNKRTNRRDPYRPKDEYSVPPKPKQSGQPKRPMSSYMLWASDRRPIVREENPDLKMTEIAKLLGKEWKKLDHEKPNKSLKKYLDAAAEAKEEYTELRKEYMESSKYKKWKKDVKRWNEMYKEEWQEQQYEIKEKRAADKKKREERKRAKEAEGKKGKKKKSSKKAKDASDEEEEEEEEEEEAEDQGSEDEDTEMEEAESKKKATKKRGRKRKS